MKQKIKPSPAELLVILCLLVFAAIIVGLDVYTGGTPTFEETLGTAGLIVGFVYYLIKFIFAKRIEFDFDGFTVKGKTYSFSEISEAEVTHRRTIRPSLNLRFRTVIKIKIYIRDECVLSITEDEIGYEEFVALLKKHRVKFNIKNSLSSWKGEIE